MTEIMPVPRKLHFTVLRPPSIKAVIYPDNIGSRRAFEKAGFDLISTHPDGDALYYEYKIKE